MRDLEIRGAGNLLGADQSGHIAAVGYDLYVQMVSEAVAELKGEERPRAGRDQARPAGRRPPAPPTTSTARTCGSRPTAGWPRSPPTPRSTTSGPSGSTATGPCPPPAEALLRIGDLRAECARTGVREVTVVKGRDGPAVARSSLKTSARIRLQRLWPKAIYKEDIGQIVLPVPPRVDAAEYLAALLAAMVPVDSPSVASAAP